MPAQALPLQVVRQAALPVNRDGLPVWVPAVHHRVLHNILHDAVQDGAFRSGLRSLRQVPDLARLRTLPAANLIDWPSLLPMLAKRLAVNMLTPSGQPSKWRQRRKLL